MKSKNTAELRDGKIKLVFSDAGHGFVGLYNSLAMYDPNDEEDFPVLDLAVWYEDKIAKGGLWVTRVATDTSLEIQQEMLAWLMERAQYAIAIEEGGPLFRKLLSELDISVLRPWEFHTQLPFADIEYSYSADEEEEWTKHWQSKTGIGA